uniref:HGD n=1 Tax=Arundo donax TaxID=35708 RepID=A0A0A9CYP6_ARUDO
MVLHVAMILRFSVPISNSLILAQLVLMVWLHQGISFPPQHGLSKNTALDT